MLRGSLLGFLFVNLGLLGCAGDSGSTNNGSGGTSGGAGSGSISPSTQLGSTTTAQRTMLCESHKADILASAMSFCVTDGLGMGSQATCEMKRDACVAKVAVDCNTNWGDLKNCTVMVSEFESCFTQVVAWTKTLTCTKFDVSPDPLPKCVDDLNTKCPGALDMIGK